MDAPRMLSLAAILSFTLAALLGGLAMVVHALGNVDLRLELKLKRNG